MAANSPAPAVIGQLTARMNRLPVTSYHKKWIWILSVVFLFELGDIYTFSSSTPVLIPYFKMSVDTVGFITSANFLGQLLGAFLSGWVCTRLGRKNGLIIFTIWFSLFSLLNAVAFNVEMVVATRILTGMGTAAVSIAAVIYLAEMYPKEQRGRFQALIFGIGLCGIPAVTWFARLVVPSGPDGWRFVFLLGGLGIIDLYFIMRFLPESVRWLAINGRQPEAEKVLRTLEQDAERKLGHPLPPTDEIDRPVPKGSFAELFSPEYRKRTLVVLFGGMLSTLGFYGFNSWIPTLLVQHGFSITTSLTYSGLIVLGNVPGAFLAYPLTDRFNRKYLMMGTYLLVAGFVVLYGLALSDAIIVISGFLITMLLQAYAQFSFSYTAEIWPTRLRTIGNGFTSGIGRGTNILGGWLVATIFSNFGYAAVFLYIAGFIVVSALLYGLLGEKTKNKSLEVSSEEGISKEELSQPNAVALSPATES